MAVAIAAAAAVGVASGVAQYYQAEKARKANQQHLDEIKALYEKIVPPQYDISIETPPEIIEQSIPPAAYDFSKITPKEFTMVGKFSPEVASYIAEKKPELVKETATTKEGKEAQMDALRKIRERASGKDLEMEAKIDQANRKAQMSAQSRQQSILQDAQRRGVGGAGTSLAAQLQGASSDMDRASMEGQNAAVDADRRALQAIMQSGQMGREAAQDDISNQRNNIDILNQYNQRSTKAAQDWENQRTQNQNQAQLRNLETQQNISNKNVQQGNEADVNNRNMYNNIMGQMRQQNVGERDYGRQRYLDRADQTKYQNQLKQMKYADEMNKATGMSGALNSQITANTQAAADRNKAIQGVADTGMAGASAYSNSEERDKDRKAQIRTA